MLEIRGLDAGYGDLKVLWDVALDVREKEITAVLGPNGAGKTTLLKTISGLIKPNSGEIRFLGKEINKLKSFERVRQGIVQIPEGRQIFPQLTVMENLELGAYTKRARTRLKESLENVFQLFPILKERRNQLASTLSGGEQQMLAIGRGLMSHPRLMLLDEVSSGLAPLLTKNIFEVIQQINQSGVAICLVEQNAVLALEMAKRAYVFEGGRIVREGEAKDLRKDKSIQDAYLGTE